MMAMYNTLGHQLKVMVEQEHLEKRARRMQPVRGKDASFMGGQQEEEEEE
jgi:hypothetical protein